MIPTKNKSQYNLITIVNEYFMTALGTVIFSLGLYFFMFPQNLSAGGVAGYAMIIATYIHLPISAITLTINAVLLVVGFTFIGPSYGGKTICSILTLSGTMRLLEMIFPAQPPITNNIFFNLICGILITTFGVAVVLNQNASTCGTDVIAKMLNKYLALDMGVGLFLANSVIIIGSYFSYGIEICAYNAFACIFNSTFINFFLSAFSAKKEVTILTQKPDEVRKLIINKIDGGLTVYKSEGGYSHEEKEVFSTVLTKKQYDILKKQLKVIDPQVFIIARPAKEVLGGGFEHI